MSIVLLRAIRYEEHAEGSGYITKFCKWERRNLQESKAWDWEPLSAQQVCLDSCDAMESVPKTRRRVFTTPWDGPRGRLTEQRGALGSPSPRPGVPSPRPGSPSPRPVLTGSKRPGRRIVYVAGE